MVTPNRSQQLGFIVLLALLGVLAFLRM